MRNPEIARRVRVRCAMRVAAREGYDPYNSHAAFAEVYHRLAMRWGWR